MSGPEITFIVHPREASEQPKPFVDNAPAATAIEVEQPPALVQDAREWDTFRGNLHFLIRYAFGRT